MKKIILAYSGGLDTSVILHYLASISDFEVIVCCIDVGQIIPRNIHRVAKKSGAAKSLVIDAKEEFVKDYIFPALRANAIYEGRYLLGTALARPLIAKKQIELAKELKADTVSHGATAKGNDQIRFELAYKVLDKKIKCFAPWKDSVFYEEFKGRTELLSYAKACKIPVEATPNKSYSKDDNLYHVSYESGLLEDENTFLPNYKEFRWVKNPKSAATVEVEIHFHRGVPIMVKGLYLYTGLVVMIERLNKMAGECGIGLIDIVESRYIGIKSRGVYETPAGTILHFAKRDLETMTMDREVMQMRDSLIPKYAQLVYNGYWFSPERALLQGLMDDACKSVTGVIKLKLSKGTIQVIGRSVENSLYDKELSSMDKEGGFNSQDSQGFININALRIQK